MKPNELTSIMYALDNVADREKRMCEEYCKIYPEGRKLRESQRDIYLLAVRAALVEIRKQVAID